jgi:hypothetical protein
MVIEEWHALYICTQREKNNKQTTFLKETCKPGEKAQKEFSKAHSPLFSLCLSVYCLYVGHMHKHEIK